MTGWNRQICEALALPVPPVLVSIMSHKGSVPRTAGARMLVDGNGTLHGTVGGGRYEAEAIAAARTMQQAWPARRKDARPANALVLHFSLRGTRDMDMVCGGALRLLLEILPDTPDMRRLFAVAGEAEEAGYTYAMLTRLALPEGQGVPCATFRHLFLPGSGEVIGPEAPPPAVLREARAAGDGVPQELSLPEGTWLLEPFSAPYRLHLFGGGHVAVALANLLHTLDFRVSVLEDRPEFLTPERFPHADRHLLPGLAREDATAYLARIPLNERHGIIIMTRGHAHDRDILNAALAARPGCPGPGYLGPGYLGMIGSRIKWGHIRKDLLRNGTPAETVNSVHTPIGLSIGADTPAEIAVSIAAELIMWRSGHEN